MKNTITLTTPQGTFWIHSSQTIVDMVRVNARTREELQALLDWWNAKGTAHFRPSISFTIDPEILEDDLRGQVFWVVIGKRFWFTIVEGMMDELTHDII